MSNIEGPSAFQIKKAQSHLVITRGSNKESARAGVRCANKVFQVSWDSSQNWASNLISQRSRKMSVKLLDGKGTPLERQKFTWKEIVQNPINKLDDDAFTRVRVILMNGIEQQANRFQHICSQMNAELREPLARIRRVEHHQQTTINWLLSGDHSPDNNQLIVVCW